jgi:hypothetical protein
MILAHHPTKMTVTSNFFRDGERHLRAQATWPKGSRYEAAVLPRSSYDLKDKRYLPFAKDILMAALMATNDDIIVLANSDVTFKPFTADRIREHTQRFLFGCARREPSHQGREIYWFARRWLEGNIDKMPDVILGAPKCDFVLAKWLRAKRGIPTTLQNLFYDMPPVELSNLIEHEEHVSAWLPYQHSPSAIHNEYLWSLTT